jgi:diadenosine tetraphosphate (Ap4A) HIT family hydrolase
MECIEKECLFCKIVKKEIPAEILYEDIAVHIMKFSIKATRALKKYLNLKVIVLCKMADILMIFIIVVCVYL